MSNSMPSSSSFSITLKEGTAAVISSSNISNGSFRERICQTEKYISHLDIKIYEERCIPQITFLFNEIRKTQLIIFFE